MNPTLAAALAAPGKTVTIETVGGTRLYGHDLLLLVTEEDVIAVAVTVDNGQTRVPWHAVNLIHVHDEETGE